MKPVTWLSSLIIILTLLLSACNENDKHKNMADELLQVDRDFARLSVEKGAYVSFLSYIDDSCVILRPNRMPVIGRAKIAEMYSTPDTSMTLNWQPLYADISSSGDLGYTYGIYTIEMDSPEGTTVTKEGTYATIWKKDKNGKWKFVLDSGNQGLGQKNEEKK